MGCVGSTAKEDGPEAAAAGTAGGGGKGNKLRLHKPKPWRHPTPLTRSELSRLREEFWDTAPHYGGEREIWDALKAAASESDLPLASLILESAGVIVDRTDMSVCYDERGAKYELPSYVLSDPENLTSG